MSIGDISVRSDTGSGMPMGSTEIVARMRSLLEWEKAFLAEQRYTALGQDSTTLAQSSVQEPVPGPVQTENRTCTRDLQTQDRPEMSAMTSRSQSSAPFPTVAMHANARGRITANMGSGLGLNTTRLSEPAPRALQAAERAQRPETGHTKPGSAAPVMLITTSGEAAQVWMRQPRFEASGGLSLIMKLREVLIRGGLRLSSITVNGVLQWSEEITAMESRPDRSESGARVDKRI